MISCQRWNKRRDSYRPGTEPFLAERHEVVVLPRDDAKAFVVKHHYSGSFPAWQFSVGLLRARVGLAGVAVFSVPMNQDSIPANTGVPAAEGTDLGRFVLLDEVEGNGETWFLSRAFALLENRKPELRAVQAKSDPMPRLMADGSAYRPGHVGTIYQAHNGRYVGRSKPEGLWLDRGGRVLSRRTLSKLRNDESGAAGAYEILRRAGAPCRRPFEDAAAYVARALADGPFRLVRHPGNHTYVWAIGDGRTRTRHAMPPALPYPKAGMVLV